MSFHLRCQAGLTLCHAVQPLTQVLCCGLILQVKTTVSLLRQPCAETLLKSNCSCGACAKKNTQNKEQLTCSLEVADSWHSCSTCASAALTAALSSSRACFSAAYTNEAGNDHIGVASAALIWLQVLRIPSLITIKVPPKQEPKDAPTPSP